MSIVYTNWEHSNMACTVLGETVCVHFSGEKVQGFESVLGPSKCPESPTERMHPPDSKDTSSQGKGRLFTPGLRLCHRPAHPVGSV